MQIQINTGHNIDGHEALAAWIRGVVENALSGVSKHITRIEVHLTDQNSDKKDGASDMRCVLEARLEGRKPVAVTEQAATVHDAVVNAAATLARLIEHTLERLHDGQRHRSDPDDPKFR